VDENCGRVAVGQGLGKMPNIPSSIHEVWIRNCSMFSVRGETMSYRQIHQPHNGAPHVLFLTEKKTK
jgi:hypothetical protein